MKLPVRTEQAMLLGNGLIDHVRKVQEEMKKTNKPPKVPYLTYTELIKKIGASVIPRGIGQHLDHVMDAIHATGVPEKMRGLTLFVTDVSGAVDYGGARWYDISPQNSIQYRKAVLEQDCRDVAVVSSVDGV